MWNEKETASVGYGVNYVTLTFDLTHDVDLGFSKVKFWKSCISGIVGLKSKGSELIRNWTNYITLPFVHTHDFDLEVSRSKFEKALS